MTANSHLTFTPPTINPSVKPDNEEFDLMFKIFASDVGKRLLELWEARFVSHTIFPVTKQFIDTEYGGNVEYYIGTRDGKKYFINWIKQIVLVYQNIPTKIDEVKNA